MEKLASQFPVIVLTGPRQAGKSALLEHTFPSILSTSLDSGSLADSAASNPDAFLDRFPPPLLIDEIQYVPSLLKAIKRRVDARRETPGQYFISGSQSFELMQGVSESLAGRAAVIRLLSLSGDEWAKSAVRETHTWNSFLFKGGYPELWKDPEHPQDRERWFQGYVSTYLERDVRNTLNVGKLRDFERFLRAAAARTARTLNMSDLARDVGISPSTAREWLSVLEASGIITLLEPYHKTMGKRLAKAPKLHFNDTGLAAYLAGFSDADALERSPSSGAF